MTILAFVFVVVCGLVLLFVVVAAARRVGRKREGDFAWLSDGGTYFDSSGPGGDCGSSDGGASCDGGGGGD